jgi:hypothetical protein
MNIMKGENQNGYRENMFSKTIDGNPLIDTAYSMVLEAA